MNDVPVEKLEIHALLVQDAALFPQSKQVLLFIGESDKLLVHFGSSEVFLVEQNLTGISRGAEAVFTSVDFSLESHL